MICKICVFSIIILPCSVSMNALEYELEINPVDHTYLLSGAQVRSGLWNDSALGLADAENYRDEYTDVLLPFNTDPAEYILHNSFPYEVMSNWTNVQHSHWYRGEGAAVFFPGESLELSAGQQSLFAPGNTPDAFTIEFWIYPAEFRDSEEILYWKGRSWLDEDPAIQELSAFIENGHFTWRMDNVFMRLFADEQGQTHVQYESISLTSRRKIVPRSWSHHLLRYNSQWGLVEYLINGISDDLAYATGTGTESGDPFLFHIGEESGTTLSIGANYQGFMDDLRIQRTWVDKPELGAASKEPGYAVIGPIDLGHDGARITEFDALYRTPGNSGLRFSMLQRETFTSYDHFTDSLIWAPLSPRSMYEHTISSDISAGSGFGRYLFVRIDFLPDGSAKNIPIVQNLVFHYEHNPIPPAPLTITAQPGDETIRLFWREVIGAEGYLLYYGDAPGNYFGRDSTLGVSPVNVGNVDEVLLEGLENDKMYYFRLATYDSFNNPERGFFRERKLSGEIFARPSRMTQRE